jgi:hypothetical protein
MLEFQKETQKENFFCSNIHSIWEILAIITDFFESQKKELSNISSIYTKVKLFGLCLSGKFIDG